MRNTLVAIIMLVQFLAGLASCSEPGPEAIRIQMNWFPEPQFGGIYAAIAGFLRAATGAHEVISTIMLNLISFRLLDYLLRQPFIQK